MQNLQEYIRQLGKEHAWMKQELVVTKEKMALIEKMCEAPPTLEEEIASIEGRRIFFNLSGVIEFDEDQDGREGPPVKFRISQDGIFVMTHYPFVVWRVTEPTAAQNFGFWRPPTAWPLPAQAVGTGFNLNEDIMSMGYLFSDAGSQRQFDNEDAGPIFSSPNGGLVPLPIPTVFQQNSTISFQPVFSRIAFSSPENTPTRGEIKVTLPGFRIANM